MAKATTAAPTGRNNNTTTNNSNKSKTTNNTTTATSRNVNNANITSPKGTTTEQPTGSKFTFLFAFLVAVIGVAVYMLLSISPYDPVEFETFGIDGINPSEQDITHWELGKQVCLVFLLSCINPTLVIFLNLWFLLIIFMFLFQCIDPSHHFLTPPPPLPHTHTHTHTHVITTKKSLVPTNLLISFWPSFSLYFRVPSLHWLFHWLFLHLIDDIDVKDW